MRAVWLLLLLLALVQAQQSRRFICQSTCLRPCFACTENNECRADPADPADPACEAPADSTAPQQCDAGVCASTGAEIICPDADQNLCTIDFYNATAGACETRPNPNPLCAVGEYARFPCVRRLNSQTLRLDTNDPTPLSVAQWGLSRLAPLGSGRLAALPTPESALLALSAGRFETGVDSVEFVPTEDAIAVDLVSPSYVLNATLLANSTSVWVVAAAAADRVRTLVVANATVGTVHEVQVALDQIVGIEVHGAALLELVYAQPMIYGEQCHHGERAEPGGVVLGGCSGPCADGNPFTSDSCVERRNDGSVCALTSVEECAASPWLAGCTPMLASRVCRVNAGADLLATMPFVNIQNDTYLQALAWNFSNTPVLAAADPRAPSVPSAAAAAFLLDFARPVYLHGLQVRNGSRLDYNEATRAAACANDTACITALAELEAAEGLTLRVLDSRAAEGPRTVEYGDVGGRQQLDVGRSSVAGLRFVAGGLSFLESVDLSFRPDSESMCIALGGRMQTLSNAAGIDYAAAGSNGSRVALVVGLSLGGAVLLVVLLVVVFNVVSGRARRHSRQAGYRAVNTGRRI